MLLHASRMATKLETILDELSPSWQSGSLEEKSDMLRLPLGAMGLAGEVPEEIFRNLADVDMAEGPPPVARFSSEDVKPAVSAFMMPKLAAHQHTMSDARRRMRAVAACTPTWV